MWVSLLCKLVSSCSDWRNANSYNQLHFLTMGRDRRKAWCPLKWHKIIWEETCQCTMVHSWSTTRKFWVSVLLCLHWPVKGDFRLLPKGEGKAIKNGWIDNAASANLFLQVESIGTDENIIIICLLTRILTHTPNLLGEKNLSETKDCDTVQ